MATKRIPNDGLAALLDEAKWSRSQLANRVNRLGAEAGLTLKYDHSAVSHWVAGTQPVEQVRPLVVEAFARRLGRPVTYAETGFARPPDQDGDMIEDLMDTSRADMDPSRRRMLASGVYSAALAVPLFADLVPEKERAERPATRPTGRIGAGEVTTIRTMTNRIADILDELGGGHARPMAAAFLVNTVGPWLRADATPAVKKDLLAAASDLVYLTGWMAMYERQQALGQRYYVKALHLAGEAEDYVTYCRTLRGMSLQAAHLGYGPKALQLADSAAEAAARGGGPRLRAFLRGMQAHAASMTGDRAQATRRLDEADSALSQADERRESIGGYDRTAWLFHQAHVLWEIKDYPGSIRALQHSIRIQHPQERQGRVHSYALLAERQLAYGHLEAACESWTHFLEHYEQLSTARGDEHFAAMRRKLRPHATVRAVRQLTHAADQVAALKA
ncbi:hypothetical protein [Streptomyces sp. 184]|uniref:hypothetical protein n=1 Tax=Streptomyces sp. 184 TaxID=1827526 RepID=UPI003892C157